MPLFTSHTCNQVANSLRVSAMLVEWTDQLVFSGLDKNAMPAGNGNIIGNSILYEAYDSINEIPAYGDPHPVYPDTVCMGVEVEPQRGTPELSPDSLTVNVSWLRVRSKNGEVPCIGTIDQYQMQEISNFDINGAKTKVIYKVDTPGLDPLFPGYRIADIRIPRSMFSLKVTQYENVKGQNFAIMSNLGAERSQTARMPFYNLNEYKGYPANTLLYLGNRFEFNGTFIGRRDYQFLTNDRGWNKFVAVYTQQNGYVPKDLGERPDEVLDPSVDAVDVPKQDGLGVFDMLEAIDFDTYFQKMGSWTFN